jgi:hypothetical protein
LCSAFAAKFARSPPGWHDREVNDPDGDAERLAAIESVLPGRWDVAALRAGAMVCITLAVPFRVLAALVGSDSGGLNGLFFAIFLFFFVVGAGCAAWVQRAGTPMSHAIVTAAATYLAVELVFVIVRLARDTEVPWFGIFFTFSVVLVCGIIGGFLGSRLQLRGVVPSSRR